MLRNLIIRFLQRLGGCCLWYAYQLDDNCDYFSEWLRYYGYYDPQEEMIKND